MQAFTNFGTKVEYALLPIKIKGKDANFIMRHKNRKNIVYLVFWNLLILGLIILIQSNAFGQYRNPNSFLTRLSEGWAVNANVGRTAFFGDVSLYDDQFDEKMSKEGSWAVGFGITRQISYVFSLEGQAVFGQLSGSNSKSEFISNINEYSVNLTTDLVNLLIPENRAGLHPYLKLGMGQFNFNTSLRYYDPNKADLKTQSSTPEFVWLFGGGAFYIISNSFDVNLELMGRRLNNDRLDGTPNKEDSDYYSYLSAGVVYKINNVPHDVRYFRRMGMKSPLIRRR